jgi:hypothetical protein
VVSPDLAEQVYGVVLTGAGELDVSATEQRRDAMRADRLSKARPELDGDALLVYDEPIGTGEPAGLAPGEPLFALRHSCDAVTGELVDIKMVLAAAPSLAPA